MAKQNKIKQTTTKILNEAKEWAKAVELESLNNGCMQSVLLIPY